ncbi:glycine--tRNA ligase subunit beta [Candidatus Dojkabacteria bacterium]|nr:glycine--tRNA ligase subunit beta [Candidatus Dojkabacteria bacterium]
MADFLLEIGTEELPARHCQSILRQLSSSQIDQLSQKHNLTFDKLEIFVTPRRIAIISNQVKQSQSKLTKKGPLYDVAFTNGKPNQIAQKFASSNGIKVDNIAIKEENGRKFLFIEQDIAGNLSQNIRDFTKDTIERLHFDRAMRWTENTPPFSRPIRWFVCINGKDIMKFELYGLKSSNITYGNRFQKSPEIKISKAEEYLNLLEKNFVIVDHRKRRKIIEDSLSALSKHELEKAPDPDDALLNEVVFLVENPVPILCEFEKQLLSLPGEVINSVLSKHQRYFSLIDSKKSKTSNKFLVIANFDKDSPTVRKGNERVILARLRDAVFFSEQDQKHSLKDFIQKTKTIAFQEKLGSMFEKAQRIKTIGVKLAEKMKGADVKKVSEAAKICKADLASSMVMEFTSLEGIMGRIYFKEKAIEEHYKPRYSGDSLPEGPTGTILSLADRIDSIYGLFSIGKKPERNSDPYGLRREAIGIVRILWEKEIPITIDYLISAAEKAHKNKANQEEVSAFIKSRLDQYLEESEKYSIDYNLLKSVINNSDPLLSNKKKLLEEVVKESDSGDLKQLLESLKRIYNIAVKNRSHTTCTIKSSSLNESEKALFESVSKLAKLQDKRKTLHDLFQYTDLINKFFDENMVMSENTDERNRRLEILNQAHSAFEKYFNMEFLLS